MLACALTLILCAELASTLTKPSYVATAMENLDLDGDGRVSLREFLSMVKSTYDKSTPACKTSLAASKSRAEHSAPQRQPQQTWLLLALFP
jgi:Ca2+-binding EF-hand superfamily protein